MPERADEHWFLEVDSDLRRFARETTDRPRVAVRKSWEPRIDVTEDARAFIVRAEVPGVAAAEIEVSFLPETHTLRLRGRRDEREEDLRGRTNVYRLEILTGEFEREVRLPEAPVDPEGLQATLRDGMLTITLPKSDPLPRPRRRRTAIVIVADR